jgi:hypothetical protein
LVEGLKWGWVEGWSGAFEYWSLGMGALAMGWMDIGSLDGLANGIRDCWVCKNNKRGLSIDADFRNESQIYEGLWLK